MVLFVFLSCDPVFLGAEVHTNNTGELSAIGEACKWLLSFLQGPVEHKPPHAVICYDSEYAYSLATRLATPTTNKQLAESVASLVTMVRQKALLTFKHVRGHTGIYGNEVADRLADRGAQGRVSPHAPHWTTPPRGLWVARPTLQDLNLRQDQKGKFSEGRQRAPANLVPIPDRPGYFRCDICNEGFRKGDLSQHQPICRGPDPANRTCKYCGTILGTVQARKNHERYTHPHEALADGLISNIPKRCQ